MVAFIDYTSSYSLVQPATSSSLASVWRVATSMTPVVLPRPPGRDRVGALRRQLQQALHPGALRLQPDDLVAQRREFVVQADEGQDALAGGSGRNRHDSILS